jgi:hypothetical protein
MSFCAGDGLTKLPNYQIKEMGRVKAGELALKLEKIFSGISALFLKFSNLVIWSNLQPLAEATP